MKKEETVITLANGGMDSQVNYRKCKDMIRNNDYQMPRLYHLVFTGSSNPQVYLESLNAICEELRRNNIACKWKSAFEVDEAKGLHRHVMLLVESKYAKADYHIRYAEDGWLTLLLKEYGLKFHISQPKNRIHRTKLGKAQNYAYITKTGPKLEDALIWCSYLYKVRSKDKSMKTIYHSSRERTKKPLSPIAAPLAAEETKHIDERTNESDVATESETVPFGSTADPEGTSSTSRKSLVDARQSAHGSEEARGETSTSADNERDSASRASPYYERPLMTLTAAQKYLATLYEQAIDLDLDTDKIRRYLLDKGIRKTPYQVADDLDNIFQFTGYSASHQPSPELTVAEWDKAIDRM
jgi:REP element-mobilizing transposase RayT